MANAGQGSISDSENIAEAEELYWESRHLRDEQKSCGSVDDLKQATSLCEQALELLFRDHPRYLKYCEHLVVCLRTEYDWTREPATADKAIKFGEELLAATPTDNKVHRARTLNELGCIWGKRYENESSESHFTESMRNYEAAIMLNPKPVFFYNRSTTWHCKWHKSGDIADLFSAIESARGGVTEDDDNFARQLKYSSWLGELLMERYEQTSSESDLNETIELARRVSNETSGDDPSWPDRAYVYGIRLLFRVKKLLDADDIHEAMYHLQRAAEMTPADSPVKQQRLDRFQDVVEVVQSMRGVPPINAAIQAQVERVRRMEDTDPEKGMAAYRLGMDLKSRYDQRNVLEDLQEAVKWINVAEKHVDRNSPHRQDVMYDMAYFYYKLYLDDEELSDLDKAIAAGRGAVEIIPVKNNGAEGEYQMRAGALDCLARCLRDRSFETEITAGMNREKLEDQALPDLREAVKYAEEALELSGGAANRDEVVENLEDIRRSLAKYRER